MHLQQVTAPSVEPVTVAEAKAQMRVTHALEDDLIEGLISVARTEAENRTGRALIKQQWRQTQVPVNGRIQLQRWPVLSVVEVEDDTGFLPADRYSLRAGDDAVLTVSGACGEVSVLYEAGYGEAGNVVPAPIRHWILAQAATLYEYRERIMPGAVVTEHRFIDAQLNYFKVPKL